MTHCSRKGRKGTTRIPQAKVKKSEGPLGSRRKAPIITEGKPPGTGRQRKRRKQVGEEDLTSHARRVTHLYPPSDAAVLRLNCTLEKKKEEQRLEREQPDELKEQQQLHEDKPKDERKNDADKRVPAKRKANGNDRARGKAQEDEAIQRIVKKQVCKPPQAPQHESDDDDLIEAVWQDLVMNAKSSEIQGSSEDELVDASIKKQKLGVPKFDHDPKLPGSSGTTAAINARLWSEMRGRPSVDKHIARQEGMQSEILAWRTRGTTSEQASKFQRGTAGRIQRDDQLAINRLLKHDAATKVVSSCSSQAGRGRSKSEPP